ncbi:MAG: sodium:proton antiporter [Flavitalea sp.]
MDILSIISVLVFLSASFSYINERFIKMPGTIGVMVISVAVSLLILVGGKTNGVIATTILSLAQNIDFSTVLLDVMLGFLLFASALHFDYFKLKVLLKPVLILSTVGVVVSAGVFGGLLYWVSMLLDIDLPFIYCLLFGALISPTDPIAVSAILSKSRIPERLSTILSGESLFNDAVGLILFVTLLGIAGQPAEGFSFGNAVRLFLKDVIGGISIGLITGLLGYLLIRSIKDFQTIFLISLSMVLGLTAIAHYFHASAPLAAVTAGLVIGNLNFGKDHPAEIYLNQLWKLLDEALNTILFVMIGLQLVLMPFVSDHWLIGGLSIVIILIARLTSITLPVLFVLKKIASGSLYILTWAGLRGGISIAMALSLPGSPYRELIVSSTFLIVIFSVVVQGLTLNKLVDRKVKI